jgi:hypothetical protein
MWWNKAGYRQEWILDYNEGQILTTALANESGMRTGIS